MSGARHHARRVLPLGFMIPEPLWKRSPGTDA
jgi:hypothetical protein